MFHIKNMMKNILNQTVINPKIIHIQAYNLKNVFDNFTKQGTMLRTKKNKSTTRQNILSISMAKIHGHNSGKI
jgi:hypothetical protein